MSSADCDTSPEVDRVRWSRCRSSLDRSGVLAVVVVVDLIVDDVNKTPARVAMRVTITNPPTILVMAD